MTKNIPNKIPKPNVVEGPKPILDEKNPDAFWLSPDRYLKAKSGTVSYDNYALSNLRAHHLEAWLHPSLLK